MSVAGLLDDDAFLRPQNGQVLQFPLVVVGGSTAAYAAALGALQAGATVCIAQPQKVVGGQYTAQALSASDDAPLMALQSLIPADQRDPNQLENGEFFCISRTQRQFRDRQRQLQPVAGRVIHNPGGSWVSHFSVTPVTAAIALNEGIAPYLQTGQLTLIPFAEPVQVLMQQQQGEYRRVLGVVLQDLQNGWRFTVNGDIVIEATDLGDLLELGNLESRVGQESRSETGEAILPDTPYPLCQQAFTFCAVVEKALSGSAIPAPAGYGREPWLNPAEFPSTFWVNGQGQGFFDAMGIFRYRRLQRSLEDSEVHTQDVSVINWGTSPIGLNAPQGCGNDYLLGAVLTGVSRAVRQQTMARGRGRTQAYLHFLNIAAPTLTPRGDLTWTADGIALEPYIREARRGVALTTVRHEDVAAKFFPGAARAQSFEDAVGIGQYHYLDFHPNEAVGHVDLGPDGNRSLPFTIPLGALIPIRTDGLILSAKSIGTTHITNSVYRMHPVEWAIGEAGGHLAAFALNQGVQVRAVASSRQLKRQFQGQLARFGIPLFWFNDVSHEDPDFEAIQVLAAAEIIRTQSSKDLNFRPQASVSRAVAAIALVNVLGLEPVNSASPTFVDVPTDHFAYQSIEALFSQGLVQGVGQRRFAPDRSISRGQLAILVSKALPAPTDELMADFSKDRQPLARRELSRILYRLLKVKTGG